nr:probable pectinesterase/pectinesterase inhibitor 36 [Ipomoea batatas]GMD38131.1 probable pectinesterase/pectinesterase inhibitor 36 [Ipomoea batatas]
MSNSSSPTFLIVFNLSLLLLAAIDASNQDLEAIRTARSNVLRALEWAQSLHELHEPSRESGNAAALSDCATLYADAEERLARLDISPAAGDKYNHHDAVTWLSAAMSSHRSCLDGLHEKGLVSHAYASQNLTLSLKQALARFSRKRNVKTTRNVVHKKPSSSDGGGLLDSWSSASSKANIVVAQDGSGNYKTINEAVSALSRMGNGGERRVVVYVKAGVYNERVEIERGMKNVMLVGDGMDRTIITGNRNVQDGSTTFGSATFCVSGDGFWARDVTFENTAGPEKHQAVAVAVASDHAVFYRCSMKGYQDTLYVHSLRQFYRDCHIYGTIDFIFGNAAAVLQNCNIFVKKPMAHQSNLITAQGRDDPNENTGISILNSRVIPTPELSGAGVKSFLGRPWRKYSRTVFIKSDLDGLIDPKGWMEWSGDFALSTLYYGEYMNSGAGASTGKRVNWPGLHLLSQAEEASPFCVRNFIQGDSWIPESGVPFGSQL